MNDFSAFFVQTLPKEYKGAFTVKAFCACVFECFVWCKSIMHEAIQHNVKAAAVFLITYCLCEQGIIHKCMEVQKIVTAFPM